MVYVVFSSKSKDFNRENNTVALPATHRRHDGNEFVLSTIPTHGGDKMAFWSKKDVNFAEMKELIAQQPGISAAELARQLNVERSTISRRLPSLGEAGFLLYEDDNGGLYPFDPSA